MARGSGRWENRDLRERFPLPSERKAEPRFDGHYGDAVSGDMRFERDGTLRWQGDAGEWRVHGDTLRLSAAGRDCEGAIASDAIYRLCSEGDGREERTQLVLSFTPDL